jgi:hypothetical protein
MSIKVDQASCREISIAGEDTTGQPFDITGVIVPVLIPADEISGLLSEYDPDNAYSPSATASRTIARIVLDGLQRQQEG